MFIQDILLKFNWLFVKKKQNNMWF